MRGWTLLSGSIKNGVIIVALGVIGLLAMMQWTANSVRKHARIASQSLFPAALKSQQATTAFERMQTEYNDAVVMQKTKALQNADQEAAAAVFSLERSAKSMEFDSGRHKQIMSLMRRVSDASGRARILYTAAANANGFLSRPQDMADLMRDTTELQSALEALQSDLANDFRAELDLIENLLEVQEVFETVLLVAVIIALFLSARAFVGRRLSAQQLILDNERKMLRALIDNIPDFMFVKDTEGRYVIANAYTAQVVGVNSVEEVLGKTSFDLFPSELATIYAADDQEVMRSGQTIFNREQKGVGHDGKEIHILTTKVPLRGVNGTISGLAAVARDISQLKRNEDALRAAHQRAEVFINAVPSILIGMDRDSRITRWNLTAATAFGLSGPEVIGKKLADCGVRWQQPGMQDEIRSWLAASKSRRCDRVPFEMNGETRLLGLTITPIHAIDEDFTELLVIGSDITERSLLEDQFRQAQRLESVGQLAAGIAHEINTPTQYIGDNVRFLKDAFLDLKGLLATYGRLLVAAQESTLSGETAQEIAKEADQTDAVYLLDEIPKAIEQTLEGVTRVSTLVSAMKEFSHPGTKEKVLLDLNHAIQSTITVARNEWKYVAEMETDFDPSLPFVQCQPGEFNQVILNLIVNAAHAIADVVAKGGVEKGKIRIQTRNCTDYAEIRVEDTGTGIPEKVRARIFDPFFTTKEIGKGTGQGLSIARSVVVDKHHGTIHFETAEGKGTTFIIRLPYAVKNGAAKAVSA
jgi:PAS domain S-box-containing protein